MKPSALFVAPEAPYPVAGGGALRSASLVEYLSRRYELDAIVFREEGSPDPAPAFPSGLVRSAQTLTLPYHSRSPMARAARNASRFLRATPPLVDRYAGFGPELTALLGGRRFDLAVVEHFWCAPYLDALRGSCARLVLDLHNVESVLQARSACGQTWAVARAFRRFAYLYRKLEQRWLPLFDLVLVASDDDARHVNAIAPEACVAVYPNTIPEVALPSVPERDAIVFSGNMEYHPNRSAVRYFRQRVWPLLREQWPELEWRLVGKNPHAVAALVADDPRIRLIGPVENAMEEIARAKVAVAPLLAGSGTRFKILEAWSAARAVVSTSIGAEGLGGRDGEHLLLADDPSAFAGAVSRVLASEPLRRGLGEAGRKLYLEKFTWETGWRKLDEVL